MKRFFQTLLMLIMLAITINMAAAVTVSHVHWLADETADTITITDGGTAGFSWSAHTAYYGLTVDLGLYKDGVEVADYPLSCTSNACGDHGTLTQAHYGGPGTYTLRLGTRDAYSTCCNTADSDQIYLVVEAAAPIDHDFTGITVAANPSSGDAPLAVSFTCTAIGGDAPISYRWTFGDGASSTARNPTHTYSNVGTYTARCTATDNDGDTISGTASVVVTQGYNDYDFTGITVAANPSSGDAPLAVQFTCTATGGNSPVTYAWSFGDGTTSTTRNPIHTYTAVGTYTARCTATDNDGDTVSGTASVVVTQGYNDYDFTGITVTANPNSGEAPLAVSFTCTATGGNTPISYAWTFGDGASSTARNPAHTYTNVGSYTARCTATDNDGDTISGTAAINVQKPQPENQPPVMEPVPDQYVIERHGFTYEFQVSDPDNTRDELTCYDAQFYKVVDNSASRLKSAPDWLILEDCTISGTAPEVDNDEKWYVRVGVKDPAGLFDEEEFFLYVTQENRAPTIAPISDMTVPEGSAIDLAFSVSDPDNDALVCSVAPGYTLPYWLALSNCAIAGTAPNVNTDQVSGIGIRVTDTHGAYDQESFTITVTDASQAPCADFTWSPASPYKGTTVTFTDRSSDDGTIVAYAWGFGDGATSTSKNPTHVYGAPGQYVITLTVKDDEGLTGTKQKTITVKDRVPSSITVTADPTSGYAPLTVAFTCTITGGDAPFTYRWDFDDGLFSSLQNPTHTYADVGSYTPECLATDADGDQIRGTATVIVEAQQPENHAPIMQPIADHDTDEQAEYFLQLQVSDPDGDSPLTCFSNDDIGYGIALPYWLTLDKDACTLSGTAPAVDNDVIYYVEVGVQDPAGLADVEYYYLRVNNLIEPNQPPVAAFTWTPASPDTGDTVTFTSGSYDNDGTIVLYEWDLDGDGSYEYAGNTIQLSRSYAVADVYSITLRVTDDDGATDKETKQLIVGEADIDFTNIIVSGVPATGYAPHDVQFSCTAVGGNTPISYAWTFGDGTSSTARNPSHTYAAVDNYTATCTATDNDGDTISGTVDIHVLDVPPVNQPPVASFTWTPDEPYTNDLVSFTDQSYDQDGIIVSYYWTFGDGTSSTARNPTHTYANAGSYTVSLTVTDDDGLVDTEQHVITVAKRNNCITDVIVTADPQSGQEPLDVDFTCTAVGGDSPISYYWTFGDGAASNQRNPGHTYAVEGVYTASCTATDADGDSRTGSVTITVTEKDNPIFIDEFGCNPDVVRGHEEYCAIHVVDEDGDDLEGVSVTFTYIDPSFVDGIRFGSCTTNFKGRCHDDPIVNYEPGYYTVEATASLIGYLPPEPTNDTFLVWEKRYDIVGLEVFEDDGFTVPQDTFYRGEDLYASFAIYDLIEEDYTCDPELVNEMFLRVNNAQPLQLYEVTDAGWLASIQQDLLNWFRGLFGNDVMCTYQYWLPSIPLTDDYLGDGKVFAFTFNFNDDTAGQASKEVTVLNNPVSLNVPDFTITKYVAEDSGSVAIDLKDYVSDVETMPMDMEYTMSTAQAVSITDDGDGVFTVTAGPGWTATITIGMTADDTDGSVASDTSRITIAIQFVPEPPVAIAGPDQTTTEFTFISVDGGASYDPDGGDIVSYAWDFGNGQTASGETATTQYTMAGSYTVTLTVTDDEGDTDTDTLGVIVGKQPFVPQCSDGKDNDNDGRVDMDDPNCDSPRDNSEYGPVSSGAERGLNILGISTYSFEGYERTLAGDFVTIEVSLENEAGEELDELRVGFSIPELGVKQKSHMFSIDDDEQETIVMDVYVPYDAEPGEYYTEITVANTDLRRSTHRMITVVEG